MQGPIRHHATTMWLVSSGGNNRESDLQVLPKPRFWASPSILARTRPFYLPIQKEAQTRQLRSLYPYIGRAISNGLVITCWIGRSYHHRWRKTYRSLSSLLAIGSWNYRLWSMSYFYTYHVHRRSSYVCRAVWISRVNRSGVGGSMCNVRSRVIAANHTCSGCWSRANTWSHSHSTS
jgi:hypothetical protein